MSSSSTPFYNHKGSLENAIEFILIGRIYDMLLTLSDFSFTLQEDPKFSRCPNLHHSLTRCCDSLCTNCSLKISWKNSLGERHNLLYPRGTSHHYAKEFSVYRGLLGRKILQHLEIICFKLSWCFLLLFFVACLCLKLCDQSVHFSNCFVSIITIKKILLFMCFRMTKNKIHKQIFFFFSFLTVGQWHNSLAVFYVSAPFHS